MARSRRPPRGARRPTGPQRTRDGKVVRSVSAGAAATTFGGWSTPESVTDKDGSVFKPPGEKPDTEFVGSVTVKPRGRTTSSGALSLNPRCNIYKFEGPTRTTISSSIEWDNVKPKGRTPSRSRGRVAEQDHDGPSRPGRTTSTDDWIEAGLQVLQGKRSRAMRISGLMFRFSPNDQEIGASRNKTCSTSTRSPDPDARPISRTPDGTPIPT